MALKAEAWWLTGSVGLLSDAAESLVNLLAALVALLMLSFAARPADESHPFGHGKAEYFASGFEGALILVAAGGIVWAAWERWQHLQPLAELGPGMLISAAAGLLNLATALVLLRAGRKHGSITLEADARHLLSDVWTTVAILLALAGIRWTGWLILDPVIAALAAVQIVWSGISLIRRSISGLLDAAIPQEEIKKIERILDGYCSEGVGFHDLRTRQSGVHRLLTLHVLVPGRTTVQQGHDLLERIEAEIRQQLQNITIVTHMEPLEDHASFSHEQVVQDRPAPSPGKIEPKIHPVRHTRGSRLRRRLGGGILLLGGSVASMMLPEFYADLAMGVSVLGLLLVLFGSRERSGH